MRSLYSMTATVYNSTRTSSLRGTQQLVCVCGHCIHVSVMVVHYSLCDTLRGLVYVQYSCMLICVCAGTPHPSFRFDFLCSLLRLLPYHFVRIASTPKLLSSRLCSRQSVTAAAQQVCIEHYSPCVFSQHMREWCVWNDTCACV